jgi:glycosyltransferase involved in cell wall biosynthesis
MSRPRIVFVAPYAWPALAGPGASGDGAGDAFGYVGGAEMQQARLARVLAARGHDVWMITADFGQPQHVEIDGITIERAYRPWAGVPGLRFFHPRWSGVIAALERVKPDIVYQRTAGGLTGQCALWARARGRRFVFACAHDFDTLPKSPFLSNPRDRWLFRWGLHHANVVLAQSVGQQESLGVNHGIEAHLVKNVIEVPPSARPEPKTPSVLWLGTVKEDKRPAWMLKVARALPEFRFVIAGGPPPPPMSDEHFRAMRSEIEGLPNVELAGFVEPARVPDLMAEASLFAHTSGAEGFPNTLLEAWANGVPSVSVVDPDHAVSGFGAGVRVDDEDEFVEAIRGLMYDPGRRRALGLAARAYVLAHHAPEAVARAFERALGLIANGRVAGAA